MFSDIFYLDKSEKYTLTFYNIDLLNTIHPCLTNAEKIKIQKNCDKNIQLLTYDILALLNVYKHFTENEQGIEYAKTTENFDDSFYIYKHYLKEKHIWLENYFTVKNILSGTCK
jgi:hypothetical protein